jgi:hypothetical protein
MDYNIREMTIGDYEEALSLTICDLRFTIFQKPLVGQAATLQNFNRFLRTASPRLRN